MRAWMFLFGALALPGLSLPAHAQVRLPGAECPPIRSGQAEGMVVGRVREAATQVAIGFVDVRLIPASRDPGAFVQVTRSDPGGRFHFCAVPAGLYTVQGWFDQIGGDLARIEVPAGDTLTITLNLGMAGEGGEPGSLSGQVLDADTRQPIPNVEVEIESPRRSTLTNEEGRFSFPNLRPDTFLIRARHLGYQDADGAVAVGSAQAVTVQVFMATRAIALEPIVVTATRRELYALPGMEAIRTRMRMGTGQFVLADEIRQRAPSRTTELLYNRGVTVMNNGNAIYMGRSQCAPVVYIDDVRITHGSGASTLKRIDPGTPTASAGASRTTGREIGDEDEGVLAAEAVNLIHPSHIQAIEIYNGPGSTPGQYLDSRSRCGVILIWTKRGPGGGGI